MPFVSRLRVYPIKSLDPVDVPRAELLPGGGLREDRAFALFQGDGTVVTGKRHAAVHRLRTTFDLATGHVALHDTRDGGLGRARFSLAEERKPLEAWFGAYFGWDVVLREDRQTGFPDDLLSPGPTIISTATLDAIAEWFGLATENVRLRLRANIEIDGVPPFWEDRLFATGEATVPFAIGTTRFLGVNPCARCIVPTRDPWTGDSHGIAPQRFAERRRTSLPAWAPRDRFDHYFRAAVNTRAEPATKARIIAMADVVEIEPNLPLPDAMRS